MKVLKCADLGFQCAGVIRAESVDEVLQQAAAHARQVHGVEVTPDLADKVKAATRTE